MAAAPVCAVSTKYPSSAKFCRRESAMVGSSSTTRIRTSLFSTFFSSLEIAAPWGIMISPLSIPVSSGKRNHYYKLLINKLCRSAVGLDDLRRQGEFDLVTAGERAKRVVIQLAQTRPFNHGVVAIGASADRHVVCSI